MLENSRAIRAAKGSSSFIRSSITVKSYQMPDRQQGKRILAANARKRALKGGEDRGNRG